MPHELSVPEGRASSVEDSLLSVRGSRMQIAVVGPDRDVVEQALLRAGRRVVVIDQREAEHSRRRPPRGNCAEALERVIARPDGLHAFHHAVIAELAGYAPVRAIVAGEGAWQEIDQPEDIAAWTGRHG